MVDTTPNSDQLATNNSSPNDSASIGSPKVSGRQFYTISYKLFLFILLFLFLVASLALNLLQFQGLAFNNKQTNSVINYPISTNSSFVDGYGISYYLTAQIEEIRQGDQGIEIITNIKDKGIPRFVITPETSIYIKTDTNNYTPTTASELKAGQKVILYIYYAEMSRWITSRITIIPG